MSTIEYEIYKGNETAGSMFSDSELEIMSDRFRMLSKISRLKIIRTLFDGEKNVSEIVEQAGLLQANVSKQLKHLQNNGIVDCRPEGLLRYYRIVDPAIKRICGAICEIENKQ